MSHHPDPTPHPSPDVPGAHPDDDSVAGEEDPGASLDEPVESTPLPAAPPRDKPSP